MKSTTKILKNTATGILLSGIFLFNIVSVQAQAFGLGTVFADAKKVEFLVSTNEQGTSQLQVFALLYNDTEKPALEKWMLDPGTFKAETASLVSPNAGESVFEEAIVLEEWMITDFSFSAEKIECQPVSEQPVEVENWMLSTDSW